MIWLWMAGGAFLGVLAVLVLLNLTTSEKKVAYAIKADFSTADAQFQRLVSSLLGPPLIGGNTITTLQNGDRIFAAMLQAIRGARTSICFETFIYWTGEVGREFTQALAERARADVRVHLILDGVGAGRLDKDLLDSLIAAGAEVERYHPVTWKTISTINNRTHRKLLIVDGEIGFTGGVGIADKWRGNAEDADHWRDMHFEVHGPVVAQMQATFMDNWLKTRAKVLHGDRYFPALTDAGRQSMQLFRSSPNEGSESVRLMYLISIAAARHSIAIGNSYFVPDDLALEMLCEAAKKGVRVVILVPGEIIDTKITRRASRARWGKLLEVGAEIHEYQPTMYHCKVMIVDDLWVSVGSTNFDSRSFRLNDEANLNIYDEGFAAEQRAAFTADLARSKRITLEEWRRRPLRERMGEWVASLVRSQL